VTLAEYIIGQTFCDSSRRLSVLPEVVNSSLTHATPAFADSLQSKKGRTSLCRKFRTASNPSPNSKYNANGSLTENDRAYQYLFNKLDPHSSAAVRDLHKHIAQHQPSIFTSLRLPRVRHTTESTGPASSTNVLSDSEPLFASPLGQNSPSTQLFVGFPGSGAPMHYHRDAFNTLVHGDKLWYATQRRRRSL
jgi:hypothetical protein